MPVYTYDPPERFVAGTVGQPGERTFYLQATVGHQGHQRRPGEGPGSQLAERLDELLDEVARRTGADAAGRRGRACRRRPARPAAHRGLPGRRDRAGLGPRRRARHHRGAGGERGAAGAAGRRRAGGGPAVLRVRITAEAARAFSRRASQVVAAGPAAVPAVRAAAGPGWPRVPAPERAPGRAWLSVGSQQAAGARGAGSGPAGPARTRPRPAASEAAPAYGAASDRARRRGAYWTCSPRAS